jgi:hypothetical protein
MERYIEAEALKKVMCEDCDNKHLCTESPACETVQQIDAQPTADVAPVKHAHWVMLKDGHGVCSNCIMCNVDLLGGVDHNYCPNCGAKMDEVGNET